MWRTSRNKVSKRERERREEVLRIRGKRES